MNTKSTSGRLATCARRTSFGLALMLAMAFMPHIAKANVSNTAAQSSESICSVPDNSSTLLLLGGSLITLVAVSRRFAGRSV